MNAIVRRSSWRYFQRHPWQLGLTILGVALGVAVVVAVDLAIESAQRAFRLSADAVTGGATHQIVAGPAGLDERVYTRLRVELGVRRAAPMIEAYGTIETETLHLLGVDPLADSALRPQFAIADQNAMRRLLTEPTAALLTQTTARRLGLRVNDRFTLKLGGRPASLVLAGAIDTGAATRAATDGLLIVDIATAQELLGYFGRLNWIDLVLAEDATGAALRERIAAVLPPNAELVPAAARSESMAQMTRAFRTNLTAMSLLALLVGMFLIYNTMTFAVLQRRALIGTLRILGTTRAGIFRLVLTEGMVVAFVGAVLGVLAGAALGQGLVRLVARTINDLYFVVNVSELLIAPGPMIKAFLLGLTAALGAILIPAREATKIAPRLALSRAELESRARAATPRLAVAGATLALSALALLAVPSQSLVLAFVALFLLTLGLTLLVPHAVAALALLPARLAGPALGMQARLALRGVGASLSRTGVAVAALMLALATTVGVGVMVASFRASVADWLDTTLKADVYVTAPSLISSRLPAHLEPDFIARVRALPGVAAATSARRIEIESPSGATQVLALDVPRSYAARFSLIAGDPETAFAEFFGARALLVSEPYAYRHRVQPGDRIALRTDRGMVPFAIAGVYRDYGSEQGEVAMIRALYDAHFDDPHVSSLALYLKSEVNTSQAVAAVRGAARAGDEVWVRSNRDLRTASLEIFDRTFTITNVLRLLAILAAFVGILSALMALSLERARELGTLRALGLTPGQLRGLVMLQTGLMGLAAGVLALPVGAALAELLIHVINRRAFGWSMDTVLPPLVFGEAIVLAVASAMLAGAYPAWKMSRALPAEVLREE